MDEAGRACSSSLALRGAPVVFSSTASCEGPQARYWCCRHLWAVMISRGSEVTIQKSVS